MDCNGYTDTSNPSYCQYPITLAAGASCILQLDISGMAVSTFALCKGSSCTTAATPLNVGLNNTVSICQINALHSFNPCIASNGNGTFNFFGGSNDPVLFTSSISNYAYVPNLGNNTVSICPMDLISGLFGTCSISTGNDSNGVPTFTTPSSVWVSNYNDV